jgi:hypothetical protein
MLISLRICPQTVRIAPFPFVLPGGFPIFRQQASSNHA